MKQDFAKAENREYWLRHPVLGDPSFDTFERIGGPVHVSEAPYLWAVNGSLYRDFDGTWYCYCGLYLQYYATDPERRSHFVIYRSVDQGGSWECLGRGFEEGFRFEGAAVDWDSCPDVVLCFDPRSGKYLLAYDTSGNDMTWEAAHDAEHAVQDSGGALAWADTPAGPFRRMSTLVFSNKKVIGSIGRWRRLYAMTVYPRKNDYIAFALNDSDQHFAWGLSALTAPAAEGPWGMPRQLLCCDRPGFYPCPVEFHPVQLIDGVCYATATSVAKNRNYQAVFAAPLEQAHDPTAWRLLEDGGVWHSRPLPEEAAGIWGQTIHGFVEPDTGRYVVMFPSKTADDRGTINVAARPWAQPFSDGFTVSAHGGPSVTRLRAAYGDFTMETAFTSGGCVDIAVACSGTLGPNDSIADSVPCAEALRGYAAVRITDGECLLLTVAPNGTEQIFARMETLVRATRLTVSKKGRTVCAACGDVPLGEMTLPEAVTAAPGLILQPDSHFTCSRFAVDGEPQRWLQRWNALEGVLGAGQLHPAKQETDAEKAARDVWHRTGTGVAGEGRVALKWNVVCDAFTVLACSGEGTGEMGVWVDGVFVGSSKTDYRMEDLSYGRHAVRVEPLQGRIAVDGLIAEGAPTVLPEAVGQPF